MNETAGSAEATTSCQNESQTEANIEGICFTRGDTGPELEKSCTLARQTSFLGGRHSCFLWEEEEEELTLLPI